MSKFSQWWLHWLPALAWDKRERDRQVWNAACEEMAKELTYNGNRAGAATVLACKED